MGINDRLRELEIEVSANNDPNPLIGWNVRVLAGEFHPIYRNDLPDALDRLPKAAKVKEFCRVKWMGQWKRDGLPDALDAAAVQICIDAEWPDVRSPHDIDVTPETAAEIDRLIQEHLDRLNVDYAARRGASGISPGKRMTVADLDKSDPVTFGPRATGQYARWRRETLASGQPWYGA